MRWVAALALGTLAGGCVMGFDPPSVVERTRIVAARVSPTRAPDEASVRPGDTVSIDWVVLGPGAPEPTSAAIITCPPLPSTAGVPVCDPAAISPILPRVPSPDPLRTTFTIPASASSMGIRTWIVQGAICAGGGTPSIPMGSQMLPTCTGGPDGEEAELFSLTIPLSLDPAAAPNHHPTLEESTWTIEGSPWPPPPDPIPFEGCAALAPSIALPRFFARSNQELDLTISWDDEDREDYVALAGDPPAQMMFTEVLQVSHYATLGRMKRAITAIEPTQEHTPGAAIRIVWNTPDPSEVTATGTTALLSIVVRDGRGGVSSATRAVCLVP